MKTRKISIVTASVLMTAVLVSQASAADAVISDTSPSLYFDDTDYTATSNEWSIYSNTYSSSSGNFTIRDIISDSFIFRAEAYTGSSPVYNDFVFWAKADGDVCIGNNSICVQNSSNRANSLYVDTSGDINLADGSVFIDRSLNRLGVGTATPEDDLHVKGTGDIILDDGTGKWGLWSVGTVFMFADYINGTQPITIDAATATNTLHLDSTDRVGIGTNVPQAKLDVRGDIKSSWSGSNTERDGTKYLVAMSANNSASGKTSDAGFALENKKQDFKWEFRTYEAGEGFTATKALTGGGEFRIENTTTDYRNVKMIVGGVTIFENGHLVNTNGQELTSLIDNQSKLLAETRAALKAKDEKIALLEKQQKEQSLKIAQLETMRQKVAMMESILTNLALDTSSSKKEKVSLNSK